MLSTGHAVIGIYLVQAAPDLVTGAVLALGSHYLFDLIPHGDEGLGLWIKDKPKRILSVELADFLMLGLLVWLIITSTSGLSWTTVIVGIIASTLPDFMSEFYSESRNSRAPFYFIAKHLPKIRPLDRLLEWHYRLHHFLHHYLKKAIRWEIGAAWQILITLFFLYLLVWK